MVILLEVILVCKNSAVDMKRRRPVMVHLCGREE
jgi:hypothetical protein